MSFAKSPLVIIPPVVDFVNLIYEDTLSGLYFMHDQPHELTLMEDGALVHHNKYPEHWRETHGIKKMNWPPNSSDLSSIEN